MISDKDGKEHDFVIKFYMKSICKSRTREENENAEE